MPPLVLFNKEWRVGTDDFVYSSIIEVLVRGGWTVGLSFILGFHVQEAGTLKCLGKEYQFTTAYLITAFIFQAINTANLILLSYYSSRGKIFDKSSPHPRRFVSPLIYVNIFLTVIEFILTCVGTFFAIKDLLRCMDEERERVVIIIILVIISATFILLLVKMAIALTAIRPFSRAVPEESQLLLHNRDIQRRESELTYRGLRCLMPCTNDESTVQAFQEISNLLSKIFHDGDLVPSDILAGLLILHYKHSIRDEIPALSPLVNRAPLKESCTNDLAELKYFFKYSVAAYGCWWYLVDSPCGHVCSLAAHLSFCPCLPCMGPQDGLVEGDGCCLCNLAAARAMLNITHDDFVIFDNRNRIQEVPYYMTVDSLKKTLVISIRGTLSISDMFTDLRGEAGHLSEGIQEVEMREDFRAHKGMVAAARYVYRRLHGLPVNEKEADRQGSRRENILALTLAQFDDHKLVVTGHSLGAGTAVILTFLLRSKYPTRDIRCLAYSPPGGLLSPAAAAESDKFTLSLVAGDDVIPRTSLPNIGRLSSDIRRICERCDLPKYKLFGHGLVALCCCFKSSLIREEVARMYADDSRHRQQLNITEVSSPTSLVSPDTPSSDTSSQNLLAEPVLVKDTSAPVSAAHSEPLYLPGRIVYIEEEDGMCSSSYRTKDSFSSILVSPRMLADHLPNYINHLLDKT